MRRLRALVVAALVFAVASGSLFAQSSTSSLSARLSKEEQLLSPSTTITEADITRLQTLTNEIRTAKDPQLLSRAELLLVLFRERLHTKATVAAFDRSIRTEANRIKRDQWHRRKRAIVKTSFWIGMSSLGLFGASQVVSSWATDRYLHTSSLSSATPYFITGRISELTALVSLAGTVGGLGTAWVLEVNPFDIPAVRTPVPLLTYPRSNMTKAEKVGFLEKTRTQLASREKRASKTRKVSFVLLAAGLTGVLGTGISGYLGNLAYTKYVNSLSPSDATNYRNMVEIYQYITIGTASLALAGLTGATVGYLFGPDPTALSKSIQALDNQLAELQAQK